MNDVNGFSGEFYYGSYQSYYKRNANACGRLIGFQKEWFEGKRCLDIGCNEGLVTLQIAEKFLPRDILGIDIDQRLIDAATSAVKRAKFAVNKGHSSSINEVPDNNKKQPAKLSALLMPRCLMKGVSAPSSIIPKPIPGKFPFNILFNRQDFFKLDKSSSENKFDTIVCFSVSKWIHLNLGDLGICKFFVKVVEHLKCNGLFILEYQHWKSYERNKSASESIKETFKSIILRPEMFEYLLTNELGLKVVCKLGTSLEAAKGFSRPILVLRKEREISHEMQNLVDGNLSCLDHLSRIARIYKAPSLSIGCKEDPQLITEVSGLIEITSADSPSNEAFYKKRSCLEINNDASVEESCTNNNSKKKKKKIKRESS